MKQLFARTAEQILWIIKSYSIVKPEIDMFLENSKVTEVFTHFLKHNVVTSDILFLVDDLNNTWIKTGYDFSLVPCHCFHGISPLNYELNIPITYVVNMSNFH